MQCDNRKHIFNMLTYGGPVTPWRACYNMIISWQGTDWCAKSFYDWVTCMTRWPVWLGNLYDLYDKVTSLTRWPLSLGDLYDLHDQATSITGWLLWPACPSDIYHWVTSMTMWPVWPPWLDDLYDRVTSMTWRPPWPDDFYDCVGRPPGEGWLLFSRAHFPPTSTVHWYITIVWHSCANIPSN